MFAELRDALVPLVAAAGDPDQPRNDGVFAGPYEVADQRHAVTTIVEAVGFDPDRWRLDPALHPFAQALAPTDVRLTTKYDIHDFGVTLYSVLHEFGHGLYESGIDPALVRTGLGDVVSLGVHESQSRLWENIVGRSRPFCNWLHPRLDELLPGGFSHTDPAGLYRAVNTVQPSLIRIEADETTYNLHIILRFEIELGLIEGSLSVDDVPDAWNEGIARLLGLEVPNAADGVLQDIHWSTGLMGYFPTYTIGNLMAAQLWERVRVDLPDIDAQLERGDFAPLREWLREHVHRHGRTFEPRELLHRITGEELRVAPLIAYLRDKLEDAGVVAPGALV
jgi:carboxypeptidase Taq